MAMLSVLLVAVSCGKGSDKAKAKVKPGSEDWAKRSLSRVEATAKKVGFSIELPAGLEKSKDDISASWTVPGNARFVSPKVHVNVSEMPPPATMADAVRRSLLMSKKDTVKAKRTLANGGFLVIHHNAKKTKVHARVHLRLSPKRTLYCGASQSRGGGVPNADAVMDWLGKICGSLQLKP